MIISCLEFIRAKIKNTIFISNIILLLNKSEKMKIERNWNEIHDRKFPFKK